MSAKKLQRYRINNCADIADDNGGYCLSDEVARIEAINDALIEEFYMLLRDVEKGFAHIDDDDCDRLVAILDRAKEVNK